MALLQEGEGKYQATPNKESFHEVIPNGGIPFTEVAKYFKVPPNMIVPEPILNTGRVSFSLNGTTRELRGREEIDTLAIEFAQHMEEVAPDLKSNKLARIYADSLFSVLAAKGAETNEDLALSGMNTIYNVGHDVLGPLAVSFVDESLRQNEGSVIFPARDATPFFYIAKALTALNPDAYPIRNEDIHNTVFNRKLWGIEDEQDPDSEVLPVTHPAVQKLLSQMGFGSGMPVTFVEVGCWGSMVDQLNTAIEQGKMPPQDYSVRFLFTHLPDYIHGYTNLNGDGIPESVLETIADTWEAFPKVFRRPTKLVEDSGTIKADAEGKIVESEYMAAWQLAGLQGVVDAAVDFVQNGDQINPREELVRLWDLSNKAQDGTFTGVLPGHTETWTEGPQWIANWRWGKIPPLR